MEKKWVFRIFGQTYLIFSLSCQILTLQEMSKFEILIKKPPPSKPSPFFTHEQKPDILSVVLLKRTLQWHNFFQFSKNVIDVKIYIKFEDKEVYKFKTKKMVCSFPEKRQKHVKCTMWICATLDIFKTRMCIACLEPSC